MKVPDKIYIGDHNTSTTHGIFSSVQEDGSQIEYIRKDLIEHIIGGALGPQDALNKIRSL